MLSCPLPKSRKAPSPVGYDVTGLIHHDSALILELTLFSHLIDTTNAGIAFTPICK